MIVTHAFDFEEINVRLMPLVLHEHWEDALMVYELAKIEEIKHLQRKLEYTCSRVLRTELFGKVPMSYNEYGAPLVGDHHVSLSHSAKYVGFAFNQETKVGLDIDFVRPKIKALFPKFAHVSEYAWVDAADDSMQMQIWSMKEALYKHYQQRGILFAEQLKIIPLGGDLFMGEILGIEHPYGIKLRSMIHKEYHDVIISHTFGEVEHL
jgi:phosphopantetheinyl transferase